MKTLLLVSLVWSQLGFANLEAMRARIPKIIDLKNSKQICETEDGLLKAIGGSGDATSVVTEENKDRLEVYKKRAKEQGHPLPTFMKVMGTERIKKQPEFKCP